MVEAYPFVGREAELAELAAVLGEARAGRGGAVVLTGAAGAGKTWTAEEASRRAGVQGVRTVWTWCADQGGALRPWARVVRELAAEPGGGREVAASAGLRALVAGRAVRGGSDPEGARARLAEDLGRLLGAAGPLLVVVDDLHEADVSSLRLLAALLPELVRSQVLVLATAREQDGPWEELLRKARWLPVGPLGEADVAELVARVRGRRPDGGEVRELLARTGGEAFFVAEAVLHGAAGGGRVLRAVARERVAGLPEESRTLLAAASVLGSRFRLDALAEVAEVPLERVGPGLAAVRPGVLGEGTPGWGAFRHDLMREAVLAGLTEEQRAALHARSAAVLAAMAERGRGVEPAEVAAQLLAAGPGLRAEAGAAARRAGERAAEQLAFEDAVQWFGRAVELASDDAQRAGARVALGEARAGTGDREGARADYLRAAAEARAGGRPELLARAALGLGAGRPGFEVDLFDREQVALLEEARAALGSGGEPALLAMVTARLSVAQSLLEPVADRVRLAREAVELARGSGDGAALVSALSALCDACAGPDFVAERLLWAAEMVERARELQDLPLELLGRRFRVVALLERGDLAGAEAEAQAYAAGARVLRQPFYLWYVPLWRGMRALAAGRSAECAEAVRETLELGGAAGSGNAEMLAHTLHWCLLAGSGDRAGIEALVAQLPPLDRLAGVWPQVSLALLAAQLGRPEEARSRLTAVAPLLAGAPRDSEWLPMLAQAAEAVAAVGGHPVAGQLYAWLEPCAELFAVEGIGAALRGPVARHLALLAGVLGDEAGARAWADRAGELARASGWVEPGPRAGEAASQAEESASGPDVFRREGGLWVLGFAGREVRVRDMKGLGDLAVLLARPGVPVPAVELAAGTAVPVEGDTGELVDAPARAAYRRRLAELDAEAEAADAAGDARRGARAAAEREALLAQLSEAYGLGGRPRRTGSPAERARTTVTARVRAALDRVAEVHPELARHLRVSVRTGTLCVYQPESERVWVTR